MKYLIFPDLHGVYFRFINFLKNYVVIENNKIVSSNYKIILLGDFINKGPIEEQRLLINFIHNNLSNIIVIQGNHEVKASNVINLVNAASEETQKEEIIKKNISTYYTEVFFLEALKDQFLQEQFLEIFDYSLKKYEDKVVCCTHSPCLKHHIEKESDHVTQFLFAHKKDFFNEDEFKYYINEFFLDIANFNYYDKLHIFGHIETDFILKNKNQIWLDSTAYKNELSICLIENTEITFLNENNEKSRKVKNFDHPEDLRDFLVKTLEFY